MLNNIKVIGFDADDTLWVNEPYFKEFEDKERITTSSEQRGARSTP